MLMEEIRTPTFGFSSNDFLLVFSITFPTVGGDLVISQHTKMEHKEDETATSEVLVSTAPGVGAEAPEEITTSSSAANEEQAAAPQTDDGNSSAAEDAHTSSSTGTKRSYEETQADHSGPPGTETSHGSQSASSSQPAYEDDSAASAKRTRTDYGTLPLNSTHLW
jgi:hypothetical protein